MVSYNSNEYKPEFDLDTECLQREMLAVLAYLDHIFFSCDNFAGNKCKTDRTMICALPFLYIRVTSTSLQS